jgi:sugar O-acyltransferase (sialic acid O-acetyltransferase NeuD family)
LERLVIIGAGGSGREVLDIVDAINEASPSFHFLGFVDDNIDLDPALLDRRGAALLGPVEVLADIDAAYVIGIGSPLARHAVDDRVRVWERNPATLVHPTATMASELAVGPGAIIAAGARLTTNIRIGRHFHANLNVTVAHDCVLGDYVTLNPGAHLSGSVTLGDGVTIGTGAAIIQGCRVGPGATVGAGAVVDRDIDARVTAVGIPARPLRTDAI